MQHNFVEFVKVFAVFKNASLANNGGFAGLGPDNAGETRIVGYDTRLLRVKMATQISEKGGGGEVGGSVDTTCKDLMSSACSV